MKYTVLGLNQKILIEWGYDATDALLIRWIIDFYNTGKMKKVEVDGTRYFWILYKKVIADLPILGIKKDAVADRMAKMSGQFKEKDSNGNTRGKNKHKLFDFYLYKDDGNYTYYRFIESELDKLLSDSDEAQSDKRYQEGKKRATKPVPSGLNPIPTSVTTPDPSSVQTLDKDTSTKYSSIKDSSSSDGGFKGSLRSPLEIPADGDDEGACPCGLAGETPVHLNKEKLGNSVSAQNNDNMKIVVSSKFMNDTTMISSPAPKDRPRMLLQLINEYGHKSVQAAVLDIESDLSNPKNHIETLWGLIRYKIDHEGPTDLELEVTESKGADATVQKVIPEQVERNLPGGREYIYDPGNRDTRPSWELYNWTYKCSCGNDKNISKNKANTFNQITRWDNRCDKCGAEFDWSKVWEIFSEKENIKSVSAA